MFRKLGALLALLIATTSPLSAEPFPLKQVYDEAQFILPKLSPDGSRIAVVLQKDHKQWLTQIDLATMKPEVLAYLEEAKLLNHWWKGDDFMFLLVQNTNGTGDFRTYNLRTKKESFPKSLHRRDVWLLHPLPEDPNNVLVSAQVGSGFDLCRFNIRTGDLMVIEKSPRYVTQWIVNHRGEPVAALGNQDKKDFLFWRTAPGAPWQRRDLGSESHPDLRVVSIHPDQRRLLAWDFTGDGPARVVALDPATMTQELVFAPVGVDPDSVEHWGDDATLPCAIRFETDRPQLHFLDEQARSVQASVDDALPDTVNTVVSFSNDAQTMLILASSDRERGLYYVLDRRQKRLGVLGAQHLGFESTKFLPSRQIAFVARDGLALHGRLTLPSSSAERPPLIVITPDEFAGSRDRFGFDLLAQMFATRGYAVVRIDHRGTSGYGRAFQKAGDFQIAEGMPNDIEDGVRWLTKEGLVDERRIALFGLGSGGVVAIHALARSNLFAAWINWNTPVQTQDFGIQYLSMFPRERTEAIADLGGKRAASLYRQSINPKPLVPGINVPSFHFYQRGFSDGIMEDLITASRSPHVFVKQKRYENQDVVEAEYVAMLGQLFQFLDEHLMKLPATLAK